MKKILIIVGLLVIVLGGGATGFILWQKAQWQPVKLDEVGVTFMAHKLLKPGQLTEDDKKSKILYRVTQNGDKSLLITARYEDGLRLPTSLTRQELIPMLLTNIDKAYPQRFTGYKAVSTRNFDQNGHKAAELIFTYDGPAGEKVKQRFLIIDLDGNRALYLAAQAKEADFIALNKKYFNRLFGSFTFET
ncbi:MAG: hypothetical protein AAB647_01950 [Patescibacteria group bacterium]